MTQVILPYRPVAGDPEDISQVMADFDAILNVLNGDLKNDNFAALAAIVVSKLAPGAPGDRVETVGTTVQWVKNARAKGSGGTTFPHAGWVPVPMTAELWDTDNMLDVAGGQPSRFTCKTDGCYLCIASTSFPVSGYGPRVAAIRKNGSGNGTTGIVNQTEAAALAAPDATVVMCSDLVPMVVGDWVEVVGYQTSGGGGMNGGGNMAVVRVSA